MTDILVPCHVNALRLEQPERVTGPPADREILPWFDGQRDHNGSVPHIASAVNARPFSEHQYWLDKGIHLHWTLPDGLTRGSNRPDPVRSVRVGDLWMPPAPNRWLIFRVSTAVQQEAAAPARVWLVESDYVHPGLARPLATPAPVAYPRSRRGENDPPYLYLGRQIELDPKSMRPLEQTPPMDQATSLLSHGDPLTALGGGDPLFATHYPSCRSVFGLHDDNPAPGGQKTRYDVYGWYSDAVPDPLALLDDFVTANPEEARAILARYAQRRTIPVLTRPFTDF